MRLFLKYKIVYIKTKKRYNIIGNIVYRNIMDYNFYIKKYIIFKLINFRKR